MNYKEFTDHIETQATVSGSSITTVKWGGIQDYNQEATDEYILVSQYPTSTRTGKNNRVYQYNVTFFLYGIYSQTMQEATATNTVNKFLEILDDEFNEYLDRLITVTNQSVNVALIGNVNTSYFGDYATNDRRIGVSKQMILKVEDCA